LFILPVDRIVHREGGCALNPIVETIEEQHMRTLLIASVFAAALASIGVADAQTYPSHPITMVVPCRLAAHST